MCRGWLSTNLHVSNGNTNNIQLKQHDDYFLNPDDMKSLLAADHGFTSQPATATVINRNYSSNTDDDVNEEVEEHPYTKSIIPVVKFEDYTRNKMEDHTDLFYEYTVKCK